MRYLALRATANVGSQRALAGWVMFMAEDCAAEDPPQLEGRYANHFRVGHNAFEVILEFGQYYSGDREPATHTKIVTSPAYARVLFELLKNFMEEYEKSFGPIATESAGE